MITTSAWFQIVLYLVVLFCLAWPLGSYIAKVYDGTLTEKCSWIMRFEFGLMRCLGANSDEDMPWWKYATAVVLFNLIGVFAVYFLQRFQYFFPLNPQSFAAVSPDSSFNTAVAFVTNTDWQGYSGESTMSYFTQMIALTVQNFASAATGIVVVIALIRGFVRKNANGIGNAWIDISRTILYILLPICVIYTLILVNQGSIQNLKSYQDVQLVETLEYDAPKNGPDGQPLKDKQGNPITEKTKTNKQTLAMGPVASQEAIKMLGTNGGGFFNVNSAHPFENPTPFSNFLQMISIFVIPAALCFTFGKMVGDRRQGIVIVAAMTILFLSTAAMAIWAEAQTNPLLSPLGIDLSMGNYEGKETRFGIISSALFATITTAASCGAVNAMHDSFMPLGGLVPMWLIKLGEVVFGGVGSGLYGMLIFAILAVFLSGLMIGRTPEYLGKKIESFEMKMVSIAVLLTPLLILGGTSIAVITAAGKAGMANPGAHGFSEVLYAFASAGNNNGSAFAGLSANTPFYNILLAITMWFGRFSVIIPVLAIAGKLAAKPKLPITSGTLPTHNILFLILLISTVLIVGALNYIPALALGPIVEHLQLFSIKG